MGEKNVKILILATTASMIEQFNIRNIRILQSLGAEVHVATNFAHPGTITKLASKGLIDKLNSMNAIPHQVDFRRGIGTPHANKRALNQICKIIKQYNITGIHAHSPLGGVIGRRAAHKTGIKIIYTAHGFQFFKGGPLLNWVIFFPIEWFYSWWTDAIVTINKQDYNVAKYMNAKHRYYIPGVGIKIPNYDSKKINQIRSETRKKLGIEKDDFFIISVGELDKNKNHSTVIKAIKRLNNSKIKYAIAGIGREKDNLINLISQLNLQKQVKLLGYVNELDGLYYAADLNIFISKREGLGLGGLDGVAHGLFIIGNKNTGMKDYINSDTGILINNPTDINVVSRAIQKVIKNNLKVRNLDIINKFANKNVDKRMKKIYKDVFLL